MLKLLITYVSAPYPCTWFLELFEKDHVSKSSVFHLKLPGTSYNLCKQAAAFLRVTAFYCAVSFFIPDVSIVSELVFLTQNTNSAPNKMIPLTLQ